MASLVAYDSDSEGEGEAQEEAAEQRNLPAGVRRLLAACISGVCFDLFPKLFWRVLGVYQCTQLSNC